MSPQKSGPKTWWEPRDWAEEQALRTVKEIHRLRGSRSAQWLADQTKKFGHEITRSVIADLENGRRRYITTAELIMFARALKTSPVALACPIQPGDGDVVIALTPGSYEQIIDVAQWFSGLLDAHDARQWDADSAAEYDQNLKRLRTWREFWELDRRRSALLERLSDAREDKKKLSNTDRTGIIDAVADLERRANELAASDGW